MPVTNARFIVSSPEPPDYYSEHPIGSVQRCRNQDSHLASLPPCTKSCCFCAATCSRTAFICSTLRAQVYCCTVRDAASPRRRHRSASPQSCWMTHASSSASVGSCKTRPSTPFEMISEPPLFREVTTGRPQAIASAGGKAKESCRDGPT